MRTRAFIAVLALLLGAVSSASGLTLTGGPVYSLPGGGSCTLNTGVTSQVGGTIVTCSGVNLGSHTNVYFGLRNDLNVNGNTMTGAAPTAGSAAVFRTSTTTATSISYTSTTTITSFNSAFGTDPVSNRLLITRTGGSTTTVGVSGNPANNTFGDIGSLFRLTSGSSFTFRVDVQASNINFAIGQACPAVYDATHSTFGPLGDVSKVDVGFYYSDCGDGFADSPEQCDLGSGVNGTLGSCCSSTCTFKSNGTACSDDGNLCTNDQCNGVSSTCTHPNNSDACSDGFFCNGTDTCSGGSCSAHTGDPCDGADGDSNCSETCNETLDNCLAPDPNGSTCSDGLFCNGPDTCTGGGCTTHSGSPCQGPDGDGNCSESCDEGADNCLAPDLNGSACADGLFCNGADTCVAGSCTAHVGDPCPGLDGDTNCAESCDEGADNCLAVDFDGSLCRPATGDCDLQETCLAGACPADIFKSMGAACGDPTDTDCSDPDTCDGANNCEGHHVSPGSPCGDPSTTECSNPDSCDVSGACAGNHQPSGTACTADSEICTADECDGSGACAHPADNAGTECRASAGDCDVADACDGIAPTCADVKSTAECRAAGAVCDAAEVCDGVGNDCPADLLAPDDTPCADGLFCNGDETCQSGTCTAGTDPCAQFCDESADMCLATNCTPVPATGCRTAVKSLLLLINKSDNNKDKLVWKWIKGEPTSQTELGDPTSTADYSLCIYSGVAESLVGSVDVPASMTLWSPLSDKGYKYSDDAATQSGVRKIKLKGSTQSTAKALVKGRGNALPDPLDGPGLDVPVKVQLVNQETGICLEANYSAVTGDVSKLKAKQ